MCVCCRVERNEKTLLPRVARIEGVDVEVAAPILLDYELEKYDATRPLHRTEIDLDDVSSIMNVISLFGSEAPVGSPALRYRGTTTYGARY